MVPAPEETSLKTRDDSAAKTLQALTKFLQLRCCEAPFWNDLNNSPFSKKNKPQIVLDTSPKGFPVGFHRTLLSSEPKSVAVNIEKQLPMQIFALPVKFLE